MIPTRAQSAAVPLQPDEIIADVLRCAELGITTVHLHARGPDGAPTQDVQVFARIVEGLRNARPDLVLCVTTSGRTVPQVEARAAVLDLPEPLRPDMASLTLASMNFARSASVNSPDLVRELARRMADRGILPELEIFDSGMANYARYLADCGELSGPLYANLFFGNVATAQPTLLGMAATLADLPPGTMWSFAGIGAAQLPANAVALALGGGVRTGLEDNLWLDPARRVPANNLDLVGRIHELAALHGRPLMTSSQFREHFQLRTW
jgi:uncharacterized protein (DUF849 family)